MRRYAALLGVLLAGCGGTDDSEPSAPPPSPTGPQGTITITLRPASRATAASSGSALYSEADSLAQALPPPTDIRFVVSNTATGFKSIQDVSVAGTETVNIPVPAANGYVLDAVSWASCSTLGYACYQSHYILKFGEATGIDVVADAQTTVDLTLQPPFSTITPPTTVSEGDPISVAVSRPPFLRSFWYMHTAMSPFSGVTGYVADTPYSSGSTIVINAPTPRDGSGNPMPGTLYFQGEFYIDDRFTAGGAEWTSWVYHYPNPAVGDAAVSCELTVPTGGIGVNVTY